MRPDLLPTLWQEPAGGGAICQLAIDAITDGLSDLSGNNHTLTASGGAYCNAEGGQFDGVDDYLTVSDVSETGDFTVSYFITPASLSNYIQSVQAVNGWTNAFVSHTTSGGVLYIGISAAQRLFIYNAFTAGITTHVCFTVSGSTGKAYVNGEQVGGDLVVGPTRGPWGGIKTGDNFGTNGSQVHGSLKDLRVYSRALDATEVATLAAGGEVSDTGLELNAPLKGFRDASVNQHALTLNGGVSWSGGEMVFDGVDDYIEHSESSFPTGNNPRTVSVWFKTTKSSGNYYINFIGTASASQAFVFNTYVNNLLLSTIANDITIASQGSVADGNWHHLAGTHDGTTMRVYLDGVEKGSRVATLNTTLTETIKWGKNRDGVGEYFQGSLKAPCFFNYAMSQDQIRALANLTRPRGVTAL